MKGLHMKTAAIITNFNNQTKAEIATNAAKRLAERGVNILVDAPSAKIISRAIPDFPEYRTVQPEKLCPQADFAVVLGGDGTIVDSLKRSAASKTPVIGINLGRLGFLAEIEPDELELLDRVVDGDFHTEEREMLFVQVFSENGKKRFADFAANDAVISHGSISRIIDLDILEKGLPIASVRADGLIVSTPTGSTAYSLSAGGPVIDSRVKCICITPICPHSLTLRPIVFPNNSIIDIKYPTQREKKLYLTIDGRKNVELYFGDKVSITKSNRVPQLIRLKKHSFYTKLQNKLGSIGN